MSHAATLRIIDAELNRAGEGLRVIEDYLRFVLDDSLLVHEIKALRHDLTAAATAIAPLDRHAARETLRDVGTHVSTPAEGNRSDPAAVCAANLKRTEQALRSLEEFGKLVDGPFAAQIESLRYRLYTLEKAIDLGRASQARLANVRLCVLVDGGKSEDEFAELITELAYDGVPMLQLRDKQLSDADLVQRAKIMCGICRSPQWICKPGEIPYATLCIINDRADIAALVGADGVHLGQGDLSVKEARAIVGTRMLIGVSTHNIDQARAAVLDGASYIGAGPTFASRTKSFDHCAGLDYLRQVAAEIRLPTFAIGGITADDLSEVLAAGISRVAVGAAVTAAAQPAVAARRLVNLLERASADSAKRQSS